MPVLRFSLPIDPTVPRAGCPCYASVFRLSRPSHGHPARAVGSQGCRQSYFRIKQRM